VLSGVLRARARLFFVAASYVSPPREYALLITFSEIDRKYIASVPSGCGKDEEEEIVEKVPRRTTSGQAQSCILTGQDSHSGS